MNTSTSIVSGRTLDPRTRCEIARYRHRVFVQLLKWPLHTAGELELDEFDNEAAVHVVARADDGALVGYSRLLPTTGDYLLGKHFPHLVDEPRLPRHPSVWELSRYTARPVTETVSADERFRQTRIGKQLLLRAVQYVEQRGGREIVFCTSAHVERLARRWGVDIERMGTPRLHGSDWLVSARIHCNEHTVRALADAHADHPLHPFADVADAVAPGLGIDIAALCK